MIQEAVGDPSWWVIHIQAVLALIDVDRHDQATKPDCWTTVKIVG